MIVRQDLQRAIALMQAGEAQAASEMLQALIAEPELDDHARASAYVWLAESRTDPRFKIECCNGRSNTSRPISQVRDILNQLRAPGAAPLDPSSLRIAMSDAPPVLGVRGGPNGIGSGMFVNQRGLVATTAYVTGSAATVNIDLDNERTVAGRVVRRFPQSDLALIETPVSVDSIGAVTPAILLARDETIIALAYPGNRTQGAVRDVGTGARSHWLFTGLSPAMMSDAGGNPVCDAKGNLVGMLTRNADHSSGELYALAIRAGQSAGGTIPARAASNAGCRLLQQLRRNDQRATIRRAVLRDLWRPAARCGGPAGMAADPERLMHLYDGNESQPCPNCAAKVGFYAGRCLRCGGELTLQSRGA